MTPQPKTRDALTPRHAHTALALAIPAIALAACTSSPNDARWYASTAVTQPHPHASNHHAPAPVLPSTMASASPRFWDARRDAQLGGHTPAPASATLEWPMLQRPEERVFRFRTLQRN